MPYSLFVAGFIGFLETQTYCRCHAVTIEFRHRLDTSVELVFVVTSFMGLVKYSVSDY